MLLLLKLVLTPLLVGLVSLAGRRWGSAVSGWLAGLPLTSGPVALFLTLEQGKEFEAHAALATMTGLFSLYAFCLVYSWLSVYVGWLVCLLVSWGAFFVSTFLLEQFTLTLLPSFLIVVACLLITLRLLPKPLRKMATGATSPRWERIGRMLAATTFVLLLTGAANVLGPRLSGLITPFPIFATIFAVFTHRFQGANAAAQVLRGVTIGSFTFAVFFLILAVLIEHWSVAATFSLALLAAMLLHSGSLWLMKR